MCVLLLSDFILVQVKGRNTRYSHATSIWE